MSLFFIYHICRFSSLARTPEYRGFDYFYGYYTGEIDYYTKESGIGFDGYSFLDLQSSGSLVSDDSEIDSTLHAGYLFQSKAEAVINSHAESYPDTPMFLFYSMQLVHAPYDVPSIYSSRCDGQLDDDEANGDMNSYCGMNLMLDEVVANTTCTLESAGLSNNAVVILTSDNGGVSAFPGGSSPYRGHKYDFTRGGVSANAFVFSKLLPGFARGSTYDGLMHVSDWLPTLMMVATDGAWTGSYSGATLDGVNQWDALISGTDSPRSWIVHYAYPHSSTLGSVQYGAYKLDIGMELPDQETALDVNDLGGTMNTVCESPSLHSVRPKKIFEMVGGLNYLTASNMFSSWLVTVQLLAIPITILLLYKIMQVRIYCSVLLCLY